MRLYTYESYCVGCQQVSEHVSGTCTVCRGEGFGRQSGHRHQDHAASPSRAPRWMLVGRIGAGASIPHPESTSEGLSLERYEWGAFSMQAGAAAEARITGPLYASGEYKLTRTVQDVTIAGGSARTRLVTHHIVAGLTFHLGLRN